MTETLVTFSGIGTHAYLLYLLTEFAMVVSPGAAVLFVMNRGLAKGFSASLAATAGVLSANSLYFLASGLGLSALVQGQPVFFKMLQTLGCIYLLYLAWAAWTARPGGLGLTHLDTRSNWEAFVSVFLVQLANPKALLTFASIVPPFINPQYPVWPQMGWLAVGSMLPELVVLSFYGALAVVLQPMLNDARILRLIEKSCAVLLLVIAILLVPVP